MWAPHRAGCSVNFMRGLNVLMLSTCRFPPANLVPHDGRMLGNIGMQRALVFAPAYRALGEDAVDDLDQGFRRHWHSGSSKQGIQDADHSQHADVQLALCIIINSPLSIT